MDNGSASQPSHSGQALSHTESSSDLADIPGWRAGIAAFVLYVFIVWPALTQGWWDADDAWALCQPARALVNHCLALGRPGQALLYLLALIERRDASGVCNVALRLLQIGAHVAAAVLVARLFARFVPVAGAALAALPFLLWGFAAECTVWRAAASYPFSALLSVLGMTLLLGEAPARGWGGWARWLGGVILTACAVLTSQAAAMLGVCTGLVVVLASWAGGGQISRARGLAAAGGGGGCLLGGVLTVWFSRYLFWHPRAAFSEDPAEAARYWQRLLDTYLYSEHYGEPLTMLNTVMILLPGLTVVVGIVRCARSRNPRPLQTAVLLLMGATALALLAFGPAVAARDRWPSWRVM